MWKQIKDFIFEQPVTLSQPAVSSPVTASTHSGNVTTLNGLIESENHQGFLQKARDHYCELCEQFYKSKAGAAVHRRLKHKI